MVMRRQAWFYVEETGITIVSVSGEDVIKIPYRTLMPALKKARIRTVKP